MEHRLNPLSVLFKSQLFHKGLLGLCLVFALFLFGCAHFAHQQREVADTAPSECLLLIRSGDWNAARLEAQGELLSDSTWNPAVAALMYIEALSKDWDRARLRYDFLSAQPPRTASEAICRVESALILRPATWLEDSEQLLTGAAEGLLAPQENLLLQGRLHLAQSHFAQAEQAFARAQALSGERNTRALIALEKTQSLRRLRPVTQRGFRILQQSVVSRAEAAVLLALETSIPARFSKMNKGPKYHAPGLLQEAHFQAPVYEDLLGHWAEKDVLNLLSLGCWRALPGSRIDPDGLYTRIELQQELADLIEVFGSRMQSDGGRAKTHLVQAPKGDSPYLSGIEVLQAYRHLEQIIESAQGEN
jgi:hypothetical protein